MDALLSIGRQQAGSTANVLPGAKQQDHPFDMGALSKQAESLWKMLDEMAENDPQAYSRFIKQQAEAAAAAAPPIKDAAAVLLVNETEGTTTTSQQLALHIWSASGCELPTLPTPSSTSPTILTQPSLADSAHSSSDWAEGITVPCAHVTPPQDWQPPAGLAGRLGDSRTHRNHHCGVHPRILHLAFPPDINPNADTTSSSGNSSSTQPSSIHQGGSPVGHAAAMRVVLVEAVCQAAEAWLGLKLDRATCRLLVSRTWLPQRSQQVTNISTSSTAGPSASIAVGAVKTYATPAEVKQESSSKGKQPERRAPLIQELS